MMNMGVNVMISKEHLDVLSSKMFKEIDELAILGAGSEMEQLKDIIVEGLYKSYLYGKDFGWAEDLDNAVRAKTEGK